MKRYYLPGLCMLAGIAAAPAALAEPGIRLEQQIFVERITTDINGRARRVLASPDRIAPGDQLIFVIHWSNRGRHPVRGFAVTNMVSRGIAPDLSDPAMQLSVDGGAHWGRLDQLWLPTALGGVRRAVPADITHVRWSVPDAVPPGQAGRLTWRATMR
ncbi:hypothetical protein WG907_13305 [Sphingobium sp. AN558]|uniref:hypothetical protein n=1 Tax=Sphingobium sp. AN558 TaxID=3133442 RepID=UPI0030C0E856